MFDIMLIGNPEMFHLTQFNDNCIQVHFLQRKSIFVKLSKALKRFFEHLLKKIVKKILTISLTLSIKYGGLSTQEITALNNITGQAVTYISQKTDYEKVDPGVTITLQKEPYRKKLLFSDIEKIRLKSKYHKKSNDKNCLILVPSNFKCEDLSYQMSFGAFKRLQNISSSKSIMPATVTLDNEKSKPNTVAKISSIDQQKSLYISGGEHNSLALDSPIPINDLRPQNSGLSQEGLEKYNIDPMDHENPQVKETLDGYVPLYRSRREIATWAKFISKEDVDLLYKYIGSYQAEYLHLIHLKYSVLKDAEIRETSVRQSHTDECKHIRSIKSSTRFNRTIKKDALAQAEQVLKTRLQYIKNEKEGGLRIVDNALRTQEQKRVQLNRCLYHLDHALIKKIDYRF